MTRQRQPAPVGERFGRLTITGESFIAHARTNRTGTVQEVYWDALCDCGSEVSKLAKNVRSGLTKSCGNHRKGHTNRDTKQEFAERYPYLNDEEVTEYTNATERGERRKLRMVNNAREANS